MKKIFACSILLLLIVSAVLSGCGQQEESGDVSSQMDQNGEGQEQALGAESAADAQMDAALQKDARPMRFELTEAASKELQRMLDKKSGSEDLIFWIIPNRC